MRIFITGCAKSGTTLLARLMHSFNIPVHSGEISLRDLTKSEVTNIVGKRSEYTIFSNILQRKDINEQKKLIKQKNINVINIYRNGVDVLESFERDWGYWNPLIWCESIRQMQDYQDLIMLNVRYEDLVRYPNAIQNLIRSKIQVKPEYKFSEYTENTPKELFPTNDKRYKIRPINGDRIEKNFNVRKDGIDIDYFNRQMESLGYEPVK